LPKKLVLASASPRRAELLRAMGLTFDVAVSDAREISSGEPREIVIVNALTKARAIADEFRAARGALIIGADTIVALDGIVFGKPADAPDAARMLALLSGRTHEVYTGVCLLDSSSGNFWRNASITRVTFARLLQREIDRYVATGDPLDKAGAYGIQGIARMYVESVEGNWDGVMGLPTSLVRTMLLDAGYDGW
jgi:septum formation protein